MAAQRVFGECRPLFYVEPWREDGYAGPRSSHVYPVRAWMITRGTGRRRRTEWQVVFAGGSTEWLETNAPATQQRLFETEGGAWLALVAHQRALVARLRARLVAAEAELGELAQLARYKARAADAGQEAA